MQNPRLRTDYRQGKWPFSAAVRKRMALGCKIMVHECKMFYESVRCFIHGLSDFNGDVQCRLATQTVTMLTRY